MQLPPGYQVHPQNPAYMWNPTNNDVRPVQPAVPAPPQAAPAPVAQPAPVAAPVQQVPGAATYGTVDIGAVSQDDGHVFSQREKKHFIDVPTPTTVGHANSKIVRLLPPWSPARSIPYAKFAMHRITKAFAPNIGDRQALYVTCYDTDGGPGNCPIDAARKAVLERDPGNAAVEGLGPRGQYVWQALEMENLNAHFHQRVDQATQQPVIGPDGRPVYDIVPGIIKTGGQLWKAIVAFFREKGDATHIETGYTLKITKTKTGPLDMNVTWSAMDQAPSRLDDQLRPVLANLYDLQTEFVQYRSAEEMQGIANLILAGGQQEQPDQQSFYDPPPGAQYVPPPGQPLSSMAGAVSPGNVGVPPQAQPPMMQPPVQVPMVQPQAQPPMMQPPATVPPANLPPVQAPGGLPVAAPPFPAAQPQAAVPPTPPPAPGLPGGFTPPDAAAVPPVPAAVPPAPAEAALTSGQTPEEFAASVQAGGQGGPVPF